MSAATVDKILVAVKAKFERNVTTHYWQDFGGTERYGRQEYGLPLVTEFWWLWKLRLTGMPTSTVDRILVALAATVDNNVYFHCWQDFGSSERNVWYESNSDRLLVVLKDTVDISVNCNLQQDFGSVESYSWHQCQLPLLNEV